MSDTVSRIQKVTIKILTATTHQHGPLWEPAEWINGKLISAEISDTIAIPPGTPFECSVDEGRKLLRRWGGEVVSENPPQVCIDAIKAYDAELAARYPAYVPKPEDRGVGSLASFSGSRDGGERW